MKINPQRLSRIIMEREVGKARNHLNNLYEALSPKQRLEIKNMFKKKD